MWPVKSMPASAQQAPEPNMVPSGENMTASGESNQAGQSAPKISATDLNFHYGSFQALHDISMKIYENRVTAFIGPSGCGKSTFLRTLNRMNETVRHSRVEGEILLDGQAIHKLEVSEVRRRVGMG